MFVTLTLSVNIRDAVKQRAVGVWKRYRASLRAEFNMAEFELFSVRIQYYNLY